LPRCRLRPPSLARVRDYRDSPQDISYALLVCRTSSERTICRHPRDLATRRAHPVTHRERGPGEPVGCESPGTRLITPQAHTSLRWAVRLAHRFSESGVLPNRCGRTPQPLNSCSRGGVAIGVLEAGEDGVVGGCRRRRGLRGFVGPFGGLAPETAGKARNRCPGRRAVGAPPAGYSSAHAAGTAQAVAHAPSRRLP
jgi:hypothetical protein